MGDNMKKVTILALHLGYGGIERAITDVANALISNYEVEIISTYKLYDKPVNTLNKKVKVIYLTDLKPNKKELIEVIRKVKIKDIIKESIYAIKTLYLKKKLMIDCIKNLKSDVIISTRDIHNKWLGKYAKDNIIKIGWEHNHHHGNYLYIRKIINSVKNLDYFVLVSRDLENYYKDKVKPKCIYIPNMIEKNDIISNLEKTNLVSIGRLSPEKGYLDLIEVYKEIHFKYSNWKLNIIGDGKEYLKLKNKIKEYNLEESVILHGFLKKDEINKILRKSSIYVMTSFTESFGIVLLEAMSFGIPCVAYSSAEGANELIINNKNGYLIPNRDKDLMVSKINYLIENFDERIRLGKNALLKVNNYTSDKVKVKWISIIK